MNSQLVFIDSDAFIGLIKEDDAHYSQTQRSFSRLYKEKYEYITSNYVFSEVITVLSLRVGREGAIKFIDTIKTPLSEYRVVWINEEIEEKAIEIYKKQTSKNVSFVDCTNMALMELHNIPLIFSFDRIYRKNGYKMTK
ncbi:MAG: PIN domain-containing protein [bacterium]|nr:PIN domain-containing protein [bacterium]